MGYQMGQRAAQPLRRGGRAEQGQIVVLFALMIVVLMGMVGVAVDVTHARSVAEDAQHAADAAALAGVVYLPEASTSTPAETTAQQVAAANHFPNGGANSVVPLALSTVRRLKVTISTKVSTTFLGLIGIRSISVTRSAVANYSDPVDMGAPDHVLGYAPYPTTAFNAVSGLTGYYPQGFYLQLKGPYGGQEHGDAYTPFFETTRNGGSEHLVSSPDAANTYVNPCTSAAAVNGVTPPYNNKCTIVNGGGSTANLVPNPYNNQQNGNSGQTGYSYIFKLPPNMPSDGSHQVLLKVLDPLDECALDTNNTVSNLPTSSSTTFYIVNPSNNKNVKVSGASKSSGALISLATPDQSTASQWKRVDVGGGYSTLVNTNSGLVLGAPNTNDLTQLDQETYNSANFKQQWSLPVDCSVTCAIQNRSSGKYVDLNGTQVIQKASSSQQWKLVPVPFTYQYEGVAANYSGFSSTAGWGFTTSSNDWPSVRAALQGTGSVGVDPTLITEGTTRADQCDNMYHDKFHPTALEFTVHKAALRAADNTAPVDSGGTPILSAGAYVTVGVNPIDAGAENKAVKVDPNCNAGTCTLIGAHAFQWLTIASAYNPGPVPVYIRVTVTAVMDNSWPSSAYSTYGAIDSTKFGTGGNVFALGLCDVGSVTSPFGSHSNTNSGTDPGAAAYGDIFNSAAWTPGDTTGLNPDLGCPDPNLDTSFTSQGIVNSSFRFQVNARDGMCIITLSGGSSSNITDYIPLAELGPSFAGKTVTVRLFDAGDVTGASNYISILQPSDNPKDTNFTSGSYTSATTYSNSQLYSSGSSFKSYPYFLDIASPPGTGYSSTGWNRPPWWCNNTGGSDYDAQSPASGRGSWCPAGTKGPIDQGVQVSNSGNNSFANGTWLEFQITLPKTYNPLPGQGWWKVAYNLTGLGSGSYANDTTTWQVASSAAPVQLLSGQ